jgi:hypothetical protein
VELELFDEVAEALRGFVPPELGELRIQARRWGLKTWFGPATPPKVHYEAQVIGATHVPEATVLAIEIGFHAEHPKPDDNDAAMAPLLAARSRWRKALGREAVAGGFLGRPDDWQRLSETWPDPDLSDPELGIEIASRLTDYVCAIEPLRRA